MGWWVFRYDIQVYFLGFGCRAYEAWTQGIALIRIHVLNIFGTSSVALNIKREQTSNA